MILNGSIGFLDHKNLLIGTRIIALWCLVAEVDENKDFAAIMAAMLNFASFPKAECIAVVDFSSCYPQNVRYMKKYSIYSAL